jgi:hypothetical protein
VLTPLDRHRDVREKRPPPGGDRRPVHLENDASAPLGLDEVEPQPPRASCEEIVRPGRLTPFALEPADLRELCLGLLGLRLLVAETGDETLEARDVLGDALGRLLGVECPFRLLASPGVPRTLEVGGTAGLELERRIRDCLQEPAVVRDDDDARVEPRQLALQPLDAVDVEMIRRLVEEEKVWVAGERSGERGPRELPAREGLEPSVEIAVREAETAHRGARPVSPGITARVLEASLGAAVGAQCIGAMVAGGHRGLEAAQLFFEDDEIAGSAEDVLPKCEPALEWWALVVKRDACALLEGELAAVQRDLPGEDSEQRRLAGSVWPREREPVPAFDLEADAVEEDVAGDLLAQARGDDHGHRRSLL